MRTANNNSNFTVEALVAKYRNFVENHTTSVEKDPWEEPEIEKYADHQLLITLYKKIAGSNANQYIVEGLALYEEAFQQSVLSDSEISFLCENFKETVDYIFSGRLFGIGSLDWHSIKSNKPEQSFLGIIEKIAKVSKGDNIFIEDDILGDVALRFPQCTILLEENVLDTVLPESQEGIKKGNEENSLKMIRFFAHGIHSKVVNELTNEKVDIFIRKLIGSRKVHNGVKVSPNGQAIFVLHTEQLLGTDWQNFREHVISSKRVEAIIKYDVDKYIMVADKTGHASICMRDELSGMSKDIPYEAIDREVLLPGYYYVEKPTNWIPLSTLVSCPSVPRIDVPGTHENVSSTSKVLLQKELGITFADADITKKGLYSVSDLTENSNAWGGMDFYGWYSNKIPCVYLWGFENKYRIGYVYESNEVKYALPYQMSVLIPKEGFDVRYIAALLFVPEVKKQVETLYCGEHIAPMMEVIIRHIFVPNHTKIERETFLGETNYSALEHLANEQKDAHEAYVKSIRQRKHALTQSLSSIESMFYALNAFRNKQKGILHDDDIISRVKGTTVGDAFDFLSKSIEDMMPALEHIAAIDYSFGKPEWIDPEKFIEEYIKKHEKGWLNFKPIITWEQGNNQTIEDLDDPASGRVLLRKGDSLSMFLFPKDALDRVFKNIISNAKAHGFSDKLRSDYQLRFSWHMDGTALIIEIDNNGSAIPNDRDTASLLEYGVSTNLHKDGHNGIGCSEIDDIMQRYDGKVEIVSLPKEVFPVKYVLTFNRYKTFLDLLNHKRYESVRFDTSSMG